MTNNVIFVPSKTSRMFLLNAVKNLNADWRIIWRTDDPDYYAVCVTDSNDMPEVIESLKRHKITSYLQLPSYTQKELKILSSDKKANASYWNTLDNISMDYIDEICNNCFDADGKASHRKGSLGDSYRTTAAHEIPIRR